MWRKKTSRRERRRDQRTRVRWVGRYLSEDNPQSSWAPCAVENVSAAGAGLMLHGGMAVPVGHAILIELERIGPTPVSVRLRGTARSLTGPTPDGAMEIGVQLHLDAPHEQRIARTLFAGEAGR